jgi:hypothetical protein
LACWLPYLARKGQFHHFLTTRQLFIFSKLVELQVQNRQSRFSSLISATKTNRFDNNLFLQNWIEEVEAYPRFEDLLLNELAQVLENLSPKYLKDIKIEHLLKIFDPNCGDRASCIQGKKRKLKRQVQKWIETQPDEVLDEYWELVTALKWKLMQVIDIKDKEMEERNRFKSQSRDWRRKTSPPPGLRGFSPRGFSSVGWPAIKDAFDTCGGMDKGSFRGA